MQGWDWNLITIASLALGLFMYIGAGKHRGLAEVGIALLVLGGILGFFVISAVPNS